MNKYVIMGPQGCGKGTQAKRLEEKFDFVHISVGDIFRWNIKNHTKLAARIRRVVSQGLLVPDEIVEQIIDRRLAEHDWNYGFVLDGFPRNRPQALWLLESYDIDEVIYLDVPDEVVLQRVLARRLCERCGLDYNLIFHRPTEEGRCVCGGNLIAREDDNAEAVSKRLAEFHENTRPLLAIFDAKGLVERIDATDSPDSIERRIQRQLGLVETVPAAPGS